MTFTKLHVLGLVCLDIGGLVFKSSGGLWIQSVFMDSCEAHLSLESHLDEACNQYVQILIDDGLVEVVHGRYAYPTVFPTDAGRRVAEEGGHDVAVALLIAAERQA